MTGKDANGLLREMIRIRTAEETVARYYPEQEMRTPTHFSIGQEAVSVGVCQALERTDVAYSGHRCHARVPGEGRQPAGDVRRAVWAGRRLLQGRGGSVHLYDPRSA